ncbi:MAG: hypothetical protein HFH98_06495 [Lachnospiraceae bacterium]|nr:hypothetical protein [uncultured Acetatifactor sp.]MCI9231127.1 hypothetical protein [Lachnospiraceae bacterium]MCI9572284.1 hypothetical protein [Lachnospiraceae bacterium]MCI9651503.1 hypothetical protein [Lachnospiraceae bacterium]
MEETTVEKRYALSPAEQQYKILFQAAPCWYDAERYRYHTWQEFNEIYQQGIRGVSRCRKPRPRICRRSCRKAISWRERT